MPERIDVSSGAWMRLFAIAVIVLGLLGRAATIRSPLFDFHSWRQADTASIARNFVEERFNPLYPQVDHRGARPDGYVATGLELHAFVVAIVASFAGFSPALGRLVNTLLFPLAALLLFRFIRLRYGDRAAAVGLFVYALGMPLTLFIDRAFMNESMLMLLTIVCLRSAQEYCARQSRAHLVLLVLASSLIAVVKPTYLIVWGPVVGLFLERFGRRAFIRWELWLAGLTNVALGAWWFTHAHTLFGLTGISFGLTDKLFDAALLVSDYPVKVAIRLLKDILGPVGAVFATYGLVVAIRERRYAEIFGVLAFLVYLIVVTRGNYEHNYYQLPIVPVGAALTGAGVTDAVTRIGSRRGWSTERRLNAYAAVLGIALLSTFVRSVSAHNWYEVDQGKFRLCEDLRPLLLPGERVVIANDSSPDVLFCLHRKGWLLTPEEATGDRLRGLAREGAAVFVTRKRFVEARRVLDGMAEPMLETPDFRAYRVPRPTRAESRSR
jgi:hypothetical protein